MKIEFASSIHQFSPKSWKALESKNFPFTDFAHYAALEDSGSVGSGSGWHPLYYAAVDEHGDLCGAVVLYEKYHSYGEYIFDWAWAEAHQRLGIEYYPKLVSSIPFTPATGPKLLINASKSHETQKQAQQNLIETALDRSKDFSSLHFLFLTHDELPLFEQNGFFTRHTYQFHWLNEDYQSFEDFLARFKSKKRKEIRRERKQVQDSGLRIEVLSGDNLNLDHAKVFYHFYRSTISKKGAIPYLTKNYFTQVFERMKDSIYLLLAYDRDQVVAASLSYHKGQNLYGRYWGSFDEYRSLHFELCYYRPIEYAIDQKIKLFEAGAQGEHKIQRGFMPRLTYSAHKLSDDQMHRLLRQHCTSEKQALKRGLVEFERYSPFRQE